MQNFEARSSEYLTPEVKELGVIEEIVALTTPGPGQDGQAFTS
jgi:hypothetical protein